MKKILMVTASMFTILLLLILSAYDEPVTFDKSESEQSEKNEMKEKGREEENEKEGRNQAGLEREEYKQWEANVSAEEKIRLWEQVMKTPTEPENTDAINSWKSIGPFGIRDTSDNNLAGRVTDIKPSYGQAGLRIATAMGGLWEYGLLFAIPLSDGLPSLSIGSFDSHPDSSNIIFAGTGEYYGDRGFGSRIGAGLYKTTNKGFNWTLVPLSPTPNNFSKLRYNPTNRNYIFFASDAGLYRSTNGGNSFTRLLTGEFTDIGFVPNSPSWIFATKARKGFYFSDNYGAAWDSTKFAGLPANIGDIKFDIAKSSANIMYASISSDTLCNNTQLASGMKVFKSTDYGLNWFRLNNQINQTAFVDYAWCQGYYNNICSVNPVNPDIVYVGGGPIHCSTDGGFNWREFGFHADQHAAAWSTNGSTFYSGSDGGVASTQNHGVSWNSLTNFIPLAQFYDGDVGTSNHNFIGGGTQDNSNPFTTDGGNTWNYGGAGDGWSTVFNPANANNFIVTWNRGMQRTTDAGAHFIFSSSGIDSLIEYGFLSSDRYSPLNLYYYSWGILYKSFTGGQSWTKMNPLPMAGNRTVLSVEKGRANGNREIIYVPLFNNTFSFRIAAFINGVRYDRTGDMPPTGVAVWKVCPHPRDTGIAYALMPQVGSTRQIFKTKNTGLNWYNVTGDFPPVPVKDLVVSPLDSNILVACTGGFGFYKSTNAGVNWFRWNNGTALATFSDKMTYIDSVQSGKFYVVALTNGRGVYSRNITDSDSINVGINPNTQTVGYRLQQNFPNPFNPSTNIKYSVSKSVNVKITVFDLTGKTIAELVNEKKSPGIYEVIFDGRSVSSGIYFYRMETGSFTETKKMMLVK